jgi:hypothetical protein
MSDTTDVTLTLRFAAEPSARRPYRNVGEMVRWWCDVTNTLTGEPYLGETLPAAGFWTPDAPADTSPAVPLDVHGDGTGTLWFDVPTDIAGPYTILLQIDAPTRKIIARSFDVAVEGGTGTVVPGTVVPWTSVHQTVSAWGASAARAEARAVVPGLATELAGPAGAAAGEAAALLAVAEPVQEAQAAATTAGEKLTAIIPLAQQVDAQHTEVLEAAQGVGADVQAAQDAANAAGAAQFNVAGAIAGAVIPAPDKPTLLTINTDPSTGQPLQDGRVAFIPTGPDAGLWLRSAGSWVFYTMTWGQFADALSRLVAQVDPQIGNRAFDIVPGDGRRLMVDDDGRVLDEWLPGARAIQQRLLATRGFETPEAVVTLLRALTERVGSETIDYGTTDEFVGLPAGRFYVIDDDGYVLWKREPSGPSYGQPLRTRQVISDLGTIGSLMLGRLRGGLGTDLEIVGADGSDEFAGIDTSKYPRALIDADGYVIWIAQPGGGGGGGGTEFDGILQADAVLPMGATTLRQVTKAAAAAKLPAGRVLFADQGDSRTAVGVEGNTAFNGRVNARGWQFWLGLASRGAMQVVGAYDFAVAGETTDQIRERHLANMALVPPGFTWGILGGVNDASTSIDSKANLEWMIQQNLDRGDQVFVLAELPANPASWDSVRIARHLSLHDWIMRKYRDVTGVRLSNPFPLLLDRSSAPAIAMKPEMTIDQLHQTPLAMKLVGDQLWEDLKDLARCPPKLLETNADRYDPTWNQNGNLIVNGMMEGISGALAGTATGLVADSWTLTGSAAMTSVVGSKVNADDGSTWQRIDFVGDIAGGDFSQTVTLLQVIDLSQIAVGDWIEVIAEIQVDAGNENAFGPELYLLDNNQVLNPRVATGFARPDQGLPPGPGIAWGGVFVTQPFKRTAGTNSQTDPAVTSLAVGVRVRFAESTHVAGGFRVATVSVKKI